MSKTTKMAKAPVYYVLAQAKFNPIAAMGSKYINDIQDQLRCAGFALFEQRILSQLFFDAVKPDDPPQVLPAPRWIMNNENKTAGFVLTTSSLTYHTTHYETSHEFIPKFLEGLEIVNNVVRLDHISRLGIRYLDAVLPLNNEDVTQYLVDGLHGIDFKAKNEYRYTESAFQTECGPLLKNGKLVIRIIQLASALLGYPPDLLPQVLVPMQRFNITTPCAHALIDTDHFVEGHLAIDFENIKSQLVSLHAVNKKAFESAVTAHAKHVWT